MTQTTLHNRVGILLSLLGDDVSDTLMSQLPSSEAEKLRGVLNELEKNPPSDDEIDEAMEEFQRSFEAIASKQNQEDERPVEDAGEADEILCEPSEDPFYDLKQLSASQLAGALEKENPRAAAIVLGCVDASLAAAVLEQLPGDIGEAVFLHLQTPPDVTEAVRKLLARNAFEVGRKLKKEKPEDPQDVAIARLAEMLRQMDRDTRSVMLNRLREADEETANQVSDQLYLFEDLLSLTNRSIQAILGEVTSSALANVLKDADPEISDKVLSNMSKRARAALKEEIDFLGAVSNDEREAASKQICKVMAALDERGELEVEP